MKVNFNESHEIINVFKSESLKNTLKKLQSLEDLDLTTDYTKIFAAAQIIKQMSSQVNEVVHASGIMMA